MFTGIIREVGLVEHITDQALAVRAPNTAKRALPGSSISVQGVCLTATRISEDLLWFDIMGETKRKTTFQGVEIGRPVNIESSLFLGDEIGGHFVYGHIDGVAAISAVEEKKDQRMITIIPPKELLPFIIPQGSVAIDGVSLTVARREADAFAVALVPYTIQHTTLGKTRVGDIVNIETDMLAKYAVSQRPLS